MFLQKISHGSIGSSKKYMFLFFMIGGINKNSYLKHYRCVFTGNEQCSKRYNKNRAVLLSRKKECSSLRNYPSLVSKDLFCYEREKPAI